jgi:hypothetical protein
MTHYLKRVKMTSKALLDALLPLVADLSRDR